MRAFQNIDEKIHRWVFFPQTSSFYSRFTGLLSPTIHVITRIEYAITYQSSGKKMGGEFNNFSTLRNANNASTNHNATTDINE